MAQTREIEDRADFVRSVPIMECDDDSRSFGHCLEPCKSLYWHCLRITSSNLGFVRGGRKLTTMHPLVRDLYKRALVVGRDYPLGMCFCRCRHGYERWFLVVVFAHELFLDFGN